MFVCERNDLWSTMIAQRSSQWVGPQHMDLKHNVINAWSDPWEVLNNASDAHAHVGEPTITSCDPPSTMCYGDDPWGWYLLRIFAMELSTNWIKAQWVLNSLYKVKEQKNLQGTSDVTIQHHIHDACASETQQGTPHELFIASMRF